MFLIDILYIQSSIVIKSCNSSFYTVSNCIDVLTAHLHNFFLSFSTYSVLGTTGSVLKAPLYERVACLWLNAYPCVLETCLFRIVVAHLYAYCFWKSTHSWCVISLDMTSLKFCHTSLAFFRFVRFVYEPCDGEAGPVESWKYYKIFGDSQGGEFFVKKHNLFVSPTSWYKLQEQIEERKRYKN